VKNTHKTPKPNITQTEIFVFRLILTFHNKNIGKTAEKISVAAATKLTVIVLAEIVPPGKQPPGGLIVLSQYQAIGLHWTSKKMRF